MNRILYLFVTLMASTAYSSTPLIVGLGYGNSYRDQNRILYGEMRVKKWFEKQPFSYYWKFSLAHLTAQSSTHPGTQSISTGLGFTCNLSPRFFTEISVAPSWLTYQKLGSRHQPHGLAFQDFFTVGIRIPQHQGQLRYTYVHYSNGGLWHPNLSFDFGYTLSYSQKI